MTGSAPTRGPIYDGFEGNVTREFSGSRPWWPPHSEAGEDAPNVIVMLVDDLGFADVGCYGAEIETPHIDGLADRGVRLANFHVTPLCSPTRAALQTGLNPHTAGVGYLSGGDTGFPGYRHQLDERAVTMAEHLGSNGYATMMVGKWHLTPGDELSAASPKNSWPLQKGFDRFYGFLESGLTNLHHPNRLCEDNHVVEIDSYPEGYYFTDDITDQAIAMVQDVKLADKRKPFFLYFAHGAVHAPLMAKPADIAKYRGKFDAGWDTLREQRFERQKQLGIVPPDAVLPPRNAEERYDVTPWDELSSMQKEVYARYMEVYAAMVDNIDQNLGRLCEALADMGELDNTIIVFTSDNGASREGGESGTTEYYRTVPLAMYHLPSDPSVEVDHSRLDLIGGPQAMCHMPRGWAMTSNTPYRMYKGTTFAAGHQVPCIVSWPKRLTQGAAIRSQYAHVVDVLPTLADAIGLELLTERRGKRALPLAGASFWDILNDGDAPAPHSEQYQEMGGHRAYYRDGWEAVSLHYPGSPSDDRWHLFNVAADPTQSCDLAGSEPDRLRELRQAFDDAAWQFGVYPLDDSTGLHAMRPPHLDDPARPVTIPCGARTLEPHRSARLIRERSFQIAISLRFQHGDRGVLVAHGDQGGGYSLYIDNDECHLAYNYHGHMMGTSIGPLHPGTRKIHADFRAPGGGIWVVSLSVDGSPTGTELTAPMLSGLSPFQGIDVGIDRGSPVSWEIYEKHGPFRYTGNLAAATYSPGSLAPDAAQRASRERRDNLLKAQ